MNPLDQGNAVWQSASEEGSPRLDAVRRVESSRLVSLGAARTGDSNLRTSWKADEPHAMEAPGKAQGRTTLGCELATVTARETKARVLSSV